MEDKNLTYLGRLTEYPAYLFTPPGLGGGLINTGHHFYVKGPNRVPDGAILPAVEEEIRDLGNPSGGEGITSETDKPLQIVPPLTAAAAIADSKGKKEIAAIADSKDEKENISNLKPKKITRAALESLGPKVIKRQRGSPFKVA